MTKEELKNATDEQILEIIKKATDEHKTGKGTEEKPGFESFGHDFSYSMATNELEHRGYKNSWHLDQNNHFIYIKETDSKSTESISDKVEKSTAKNWNSLKLNEKTKSQILTQLISDFCVSYKEGTTKVEKDPEWVKKIQDEAIKKAMEEASL